MNRQAGPCRPLSPKTTVMKSFISKQPIRTLLLAVLAIALSSCNRGYGCPTNFSLKGFISNMFEALIALF